ncbi:DUF1134 domain-containing protein [Leptolyngbya sp. 15MV]|nr:DUF1134 domain-containing protein [Leptolyngbya sp. 15MV]
MRLTTLTRRSLAALLGAGALAATPLAAQQIETMDPNEFAIDGDLAEQPGDQSVYVAPAPAEPVPVDTAAAPTWSEPGAVPAEQAVASVDGSTYGEDDLIGAAEGLFGKGAEGLARMIQNLLKDQGQPNAYIVGREAGGAFIFGARYGSGTLHHKVEGERRVYWTGPSIGFDAGANAANTFVLVYNLYDSEELYSRFPAGEGQIYVIGGLTASYLAWRAECRHGGGPYRPVGGANGADRA